jgi:hypothetical protein|tara:strand:+ start:106 stop:279 length:174 start_codon:yes stop_codon:yes gene_type:complete
MPSKTPKTSLSVSRRNEYLVDIADAYADKINMSRSDFLFSLVREYHIKERRLNQNAL